MFNLKIVNRYYVTVSLGWHDSSYLTSDKLSSLTHVVYVHYISPLSYMFSIVRILSTALHAISSLAVNCMLILEVTVNTFGKLLH